MPYGHVVGSDQRLSRLLSLHYSSISTLIFSPHLSLQSSSNPILAIDYMFRLLSENSDVDLTGGQPKSCHRGICTCHPRCHLVVTDSQSIGALRRPPYTKRRFCSGWKPLEPFFQQIDYAQSRRYAHILGVWIAENQDFVPHTFLWKYVFSTFCVPSFVAKLSAENSVKTNHFSGCRSYRGKMCIYLAPCS